MNCWIDIGEIDQFPRAGARTVEMPDGPIAVFRTGDDRLFALADRCPHRGGPLSQGMVYGNFVACPLHNWRIDLTTGVAVAPDEGCAGRHEVRLVDGRVQLRAS